MNVQCLILNRTVIRGEVRIMAVTEKKKVWVKPDRKMTMEELWERFE